MATAISTKLKPSLEKMPTKKRTMLISDLLLSMTRLRSSSPSISKITQEILREDSRHYELSTCSEKKIHTIIANSSPLKFQYTYSHNTVMAIGPKSLTSRIANFVFIVAILKDLFSELVFESVDNQKLNCDFKITLASLRLYLKCAKTHKVC